MKAPIILLAGQAGVGKDEVGKHLWKSYNAVTVAQADPMKRFGASVFGFSEWQLWGPSEARNLPDTRYKSGLHLHKVMKEVSENFYSEKDRWLDEVCIEETVETQIVADQLLTQWFQGIVDRVGLGQGLTPRLVLQTLGSEVGRGISKSIWNRYALRVANRLLDDGKFFHRNWGLSYSRTTGLTFNDSSERPQFVVVSDGRFFNEIEGVQKADGIALLIQRPGSGASAAAEAAGIKAHQSERELGEVPVSVFDGVIVNEGTIDDLYELVDKAVAVFYPWAVKE